MLCGGTGLAVVCLMSQTVAGLLSASPCSSSKSCSSLDLMEAKSMDSTSTLGCLGLPRMFQRVEGVLDSVGVFSRSCWRSVVLMVTVWGPAELGVDETTVSRIFQAPELGVENSLAGKFWSNFCRSELLGPEVCASFASFRRVVAFQVPDWGILNSCRSKFAWRMSCNWVREGSAKAVPDCCGGVRPAPDATKLLGFRLSWSRLKTLGLFCLDGMASPPRKPSAGWKLPSLGLVGGVIHSPLGTGFPANTCDLIFHFPEAGATNSCLLTPFRRSCSSVSLNLICLISSCFDSAANGWESELD